MEEKKKTNKRNKVRGNGEGTIYYSEKLDKYVAQYVEPDTRKKKNFNTKEK